MLSFPAGELLSKNEIFQQKSAASMPTPENGLSPTAKVCETLPSVLDDLANA